MGTSRSGNDEKVRLQVANQAYERVGEFKYLGMIMNENNEIEKEVNKRPRTENAYLYTTRKIAEIANSPKTNEP